MGLTAHTLIMITLYQYGYDRVNEKILRKYLDEYVFPRLLTVLADYRDRNKSVYGSNFDEDEFRAIVDEFMRAWNSSELSDKILVVDKLIHYQHNTGNFFDENIDEEYEIAERVLDRLLGPRFMNECAEREMNP